MINKTAKLSLLAIMMTVASVLPLRAAESKPGQPSGAPPPANAVARPAVLGKPLSVDLGGGVMMEFVWVEPLKMWVGKYKVTNGEMRQFAPKWISGSGLYARFSEEITNGAKVDLEQDRQPAGQIPWKVAKAFCKWLTEKARRDGQIGSDLEFRLPYDWEWSVTVGLDEPREGTPMEKDGKILGEYPWGTQWPPPSGIANYAGYEVVDVEDMKLRPITLHHPRMKGYKDGYSLPSPVGSFAPNKFGLYDMGSLTHEWCEDFYNGVSGYHMMRGETWWDGWVTNEMLSSKRVYEYSLGVIHIHAFELGFRVVCADPARVLTSSARKQIETADSSKQKSPSSVKVPAKRAPPAESMTTDLSGGVAMEFVWVEPLGMKVGKYEVTNAEYRRYRPGHNSGKIEMIDKRDTYSKSLNGDRQPVVQVSWEDAKGFCRWLTEKARKEGKLAGGLEYRLPADWEWSVAVGLDEPREGTPQEKDGKIAGPDWQNKMLITNYYNPAEKGKITGVYPWGTEWPPLHDQGRYYDRFYRREYPFNVTSPVGSCKANQYGLYDMGGNVWEWCEDYYDGKDGRRVLRGAAWNCFEPRIMLSSIRAQCNPSTPTWSGGFRVVCAGAAR